MHESRLKKLLSQYFNNSISREDCEELLKYLDSEEDSYASRLIDNFFEGQIPKTAFDVNQKEQLYDRVISEIRKSSDNDTSKSKNSLLARYRNWYQVAALLIATFSIGFLIYIKGDHRGENKQQISEIKNDILLPDINSGVLTLPDGRTIVVNDSLEGVFAKEDGVEIGKSTDGSIYYETSSNKLADKQAAYNSFRTSKGHTFKMLLPDGTKVWLNAESTLHFPLTFTSAKRVVELVGEAYFEVAHDSSKPFEVKANGSLIQVFGTHFNVSAYQDEGQTVTTLVEGSVIVSKDGNNLALKPGEQALVNSKTGTINKVKADLKSIMAWKNGYFRFDNEPIENIIHKISRWYDIKDVKYQGNFDDRFTGTFQRSKNLSELFDHFEKISSMRFKIEEGRVVIME